MTHKVLKVQQTLRLMFPYQLNKLVNKLIILLATDAFMIPSLVYTAKSANELEGTSRYISPSKEDH